MGVFENARFQNRLSELGASSDLIWFLGSSIGLGFTLIAAFLFPVSISDAGTFWAYASLLLRGGLYFSAGELISGKGGESLERLFQLGIVAGIFELLVDWVLVHLDQGQLIYLGNDVVLLASPIWMPLAWACVIVELGYPALRLYRAFRQRFSILLSAVLSSLFVGISAGVMVGFYEFLAARAGWWRYGPAKVMLGLDCALFIPLGEVLMFLTILPLAAKVIGEEEKRKSTTLISGFLFALAIGIGYGLAYFVLEF